MDFGFSFTVKTKDDAKTSVWAQHVPAGFKTALAMMIDQLPDHPAYGIRVECYGCIGETEPPPPSGHVSIWVGHSNTI